MLYSSSFLVVILIYFVSGYFRYYAIAIASGSMETLISKGDVVIVDKEYKTLSKKILSLIIMRAKL